MLSLSGPYTYAGAVLSALIVVFTIIGLTMHKDFYAGRGRKDFFCFYTNVSNLVVLLYFSFAAPALYRTERFHPLIAHTEFAVMMCIMLTHCVFHLLLYPAVRIAAQQMPRTSAYWITYADNFIIHYLVPLSVLFYWLLCSPQKQTLGAADALYWTALPIAYIGTVYLRANTGRIIEETCSPYPYPFLDTSVFGTKRVLVFCIGLYGICVLCGLAIVALIHVIPL